MSDTADESALRKRLVREPEHETTRRPDRETPSRGWTAELQASAGNRGMSALLSRPGFASGTRLAPSLGSSAVTRMLLRATDAESPEEELAQAKHTTDAISRAEEVPEEEEELVSAKHDAGPVLGAEGGALDEGTTRRIDSLRGGGQPLDSHVQAKMEGHFGADFSGVRVHQDGESDALARSISARAFTTGSDVFLRQAERSSDMSLIAHELTHVVQQSSGGGGAAGGMQVGAANDPLESEADQEAMLLNSGGTSRFLDDSDSAR